MPRSPACRLRTRTKAIVSRLSADIGQALLAAPLDPKGWDSALKKLAKHTGSARGELIAIGGAHSIPFNWITDASAEAMDEFVTIGGGDPSLNWRVACIASPFEVRSETDYAEARRRNGARCDAYDEWAHRHQMTHGCQTVLLHERGTMFGLAVLRTDADGVTTEAQREAFAEVAPFALAATRMQHAIEHQGAALIAGALDAVGAAAFLCDGRGKVAALTAAGEDSLRTPPGLRLAEGLLSGRRPDEDRQLQAAIGRALDGTEITGEVARFWLRGARGAANSRLCEVFALPRREWSFGFEPRVLVVVRLPNDVDEARRGSIRSLLDLTPAEADVAVLAADGMAREQIAQQRGTAFETVNAQMKSLFRKADVTREAELVALLNRLTR